MPGAGIIYISYPYLLISTYNLPYFLKVTDLRTYETAGLFAIKGNGPEEFLSFKIINRTYPDELMKEMK